MNKKVRAFLVLARALRVDADDGEDVQFAAELQSGDLDWSCLLRLADREYATTTLAAALLRRRLLERLPDPVRGALQRRHVMGAAVNQRIRRQAEEAIAILNAAGCTPMVLKGGLHLFEAPAEEIGARVLRDLDLVVPADRLDDCVDALRRSGYVPEGEHEDWTYHYRPLHHPGHLVPIELHVLPGEQRRFMSPEEAWGEAVPLPVADLSMAALCPTHRIAHNVFHSEVQDAGFALGEVWLRQLHDLAVVCRRYEGAIDWPALSTRMRQHGLERAFRARMHLASELLGAPSAGLATGDWCSRFHLRRCLAQQRWPGLADRLRWVAGVLGPVRAHHIDLIYASGTGGLRLQVQRARHAGRLLRKHRGELRARAAARGRNLE